MHLIIVIRKISDDHFMDHKCNAYLFNGPIQKVKIKSLYINHLRAYEVHKRLYFKVALYHRCIRKEIQLMIQWFTDIAKHT